MNNKRPLLVNMLFEDIHVTITQNNRIVVNAFLDESFVGKYITPSLLFVQLVLPFDVFRTK